MRGFFEALGVPFPEADETLMAAVGRMTADVGNEVEQSLVPAVNYEINQVLLGIDSAVSPEFARAMSAYTSGPNLLGQISDNFRALGQLSSNSAKQIQQTKVYAITIAA